MTRIRLKKCFISLILFFGLMTAVSAMISAQESAAENQNMAITLENRDIPRFQEQAARMEQGDVDLLMVGDSITHGWEGAGKDVWAKYYGNRKAMNFGISGDRTGHVLWRIENSPMNKISPKMAVVMIGTNNVGHGSSNSAQTVEGIQLIVDKLKALYPQAKILLLDVFPRDANPNGKMRQAVNEINAGLEPIYGGDKVENVKLLDISSLFLTDAGVLPAELMPDFLHPNAAGYELWAAAAEPYIVEALGETVPSTVGEARPDEWWQNRFKEKAALVEQGDIDILMVGDSITHGWDGAGVEQWNKYYGDKKAINMGIGGDQTEQVIWRLEHYALDKINPKAAVLLIGVNDTASGDPPQNVALGIRKIVSILKDNYPAMKITVLKVFPWGNADEKTAKQAKVDLLNVAIEPMLLGFDHVQVLDLGPKFLDMKGNLTPIVMPDFLHPNAFGYEIWGNAMDAVVKEMLQ